jgi:hypothetical protein
MSSAGFFSFSSRRGRWARWPRPGPVRERETKHQDRQGADDTLRWLPPDEAEFGHLEDQRADHVAGGHHSPVR